MYEYSHTYTYTYGWWENFSTQTQWLFKKNVLILRQQLQQAVFP